MNAGFDWNDLKYFLAVARNGGLSRAALELGSSAATVSRHVSALEARLGVRLFVRLQTGYLLTDEGSALFERVAEVERSTQAVERSSAANGQEVSGWVRLAASESVGTRLVAPHLPRLHERHPALRVELMLSLQRADLARREADIALRIADPTQDDSLRDHIAHEVGRVRYGLYAAPALRAGEPPGDWRRLDHVAWPREWAHLPAGRWLAQAVAGRQPVFAANSLESQAAAARAGLGVALLPEYIGRDDPGLTRVPADGPLPESGIWLVYHRDLKTSARLAAVRDFLLDVVGAALAPAPGPARLAPAPSTP